MFLSKIIFPSNNLRTFLIKTEHFGLVHVKQKSKVTDQGQLFYQFDEVIVLNVYFTTIADNNHGWIVFPEMWHDNLFHHELDKGGFIKLDSREFGTIGIYKELIFLS